MKKILLVEDEVHVVSFIKKGLTEEGFEVSVAFDGKSGLSLALENQFDFIILDIMLPELNGLEVCKEIRKLNLSIPILFLTALGTSENIVLGLDSGADDYLVKPYAFAELSARVEALARRRETGSVQTLLRVGDLEMDLIGRSVHRQGQEIDLQPREFQLLEFMMRHAGQAVTRTMLLEKVWEYHFDPQTNVIDVHVSRLRAKIDKGFDRPMLQTVRGAGYRLDA
jgi:two-component system OmpR family response regulator